MRAKLPIPVAVWTPEQLAALESGASWGEVDLLKPSESSGKTHKEMA